MLNNKLKIFFFIQLPFLLLFMQYQVNWLYSDVNPTIVLFFNVITMAIATLFVIKYSRDKVTSILFLLGALMGIFLFCDLFKALGIAVFLAYGYSSMLKSKNSLNQILVIFFVINAFLIVVQTLGINSWFYSYQFYSPNWTRINPWLSNADGYIPLHQMRASGVFPSTIYLSLFQCLIFSQLISSTHFSVRSVRFLIGFIFALIGSTVSVMLFLFTLLFVFSKRSILYFHLGFILCIFLLFAFSPELYGLNYDLDGKLARFYTRFIDVEGNSVFTSNLINFVMMISILSFFLGSCFVVLRKRISFDLLNIVIFFIVTITPMMFHYILGDIRYWYIVGGSLAHLMMTTFTFQKNGLAET